MVPDLDNPFFSSLAQSLSRTFEPSDVDLLVFSADSDLHIEKRGVQSFLGRQVDALIMIPCHDEDSAANVELASRSVTTIQLDRCLPATSAHFVGCDNSYGMELGAPTRDRGGGDVGRRARRLRRRDDRVLVRLGNGWPASPGAFGGEPSPSSGRSTWSGASEPLTTSWRAA